MSSAYSVSSFSAKKNHIIQKNIIQALFSINSSAFFGSESYFSLEYKFTIKHHVITHVFRQTFMVVMLNYHIIISYYYIKLSYLL